MIWEQQQQQQQETAVREWSAWEIQRRRKKNSAQIKSTWNNILFCKRKELKKSVRQWLRFDGIDLCAVCHVKQSFNTFFKSLVGVFRSVDYHLKIHNFFNIIPIFIHKSIIGDEIFKDPFDWFYSLGFILHTTHRIVLFHWRK